MKFISQLTLFMFFLIEAHVIIASDQPLNPRESFVTRIRSISATSQIHSYGSTDGSTDEEGTGHEEEDDDNDDDKLRRRKQLHATVVNQRIKANQKI